MRKKLLPIVLCLFLSFLSIQGIHAKSESLVDDGKYHVVNVDPKGNYKLLKTFDTYADAKDSHTLLHTKYNNLGITFGSSFLMIEQGVVSFDTSSECDVNTEYQLADSEETGYLNGCYGNDALFLEYRSSNNSMKFKISGVVGWVDGANVTLYPIEKVPHVSDFIVEDGVLYHRLKSNALSPTYSNTIALSNAPSYLKEDTTYYSYDTHYFYTSYKIMGNDQRNGVYTHALNASTPYYNTYQYLNHRSTSAYTPKQLNEYFKDSLALNATITDFYDKDNYIHDILTQSLLYQGSDALFQYQNQFGANAMMMLSLALNESAYGRSYLSYTKNNLFGHAAYDSSAQESAARYDSVANSVYSHALHYINESYLNPKAFQFHGGFFGNKAGGMNVSYASDPYWGEKAAQYYYALDSTMGNLDGSRYALGIANQNGVKVYQKASTKSSVLYSFAKGYDASFILLEKIDNKSDTWYRVQSDVALNKAKDGSETSSYPFKTSVGYVRAKDLVSIQNKKQLKEKNYVIQTFNAEEGSFYPDRKTITLQVENGKMPVVLPPSKDHALFNGWDIELEPATNNLSYNATYKAVSSIELIEKPATKYNVGDTLNLKNGKIQINFKDGDTQEENLTTDMVRNYQSDTKGKQTLEIIYAGCTTHYEINVSNSEEEKKNELSERAAYIIKTYSGKTQLNTEAMDEITRFREDCAKIQSFQLTMDQTRIIDRIYQENLKPRYSVIIHDDVYDLQLSGLANALHGEQNFLNKFMPKTINLHVDDEISDKKMELVKKVADANKMQIAGYIEIEGTNDFSSLKPKEELVYSIQKAQKDKAHRAYRIYYINEEDVYQLPTKQSKDRILFANDQLGSYAIVYQNVDQLEDSEDFKEVNTIEHNGKDYIKTYLILPAAILCVVLVVVLFLLVYRRRRRHHR